MERQMRTKDLNPELWKIFDEYVHGFIDRRGFFDRASKYVVAPMTAAMVLDLMSPQFAQAQVVAPDDKRIKTEWVEIDSPKGYGKIKALVAKPANATGKLPTVLVIHENRGLNPHIEDVTRRLALEGYIAFAPDALFPLGGYPGDEDSARSLFARLDQEKTREDFLAAMAWLARVDGGNGRLGAVGFCYGGAITNFLATRVPELGAAVPFYGMSAPLEDVPRIKAELLVVLASDDERINAAWPAYEAALKQAGVRHSLYQPPGTQHGFNNDTTPRYDEAAAAEAWRRMLALFARTLAGTKAAAAA